MIRHQKVVVVTSSICLMIVSGFALRLNRVEPNGSTKGSEAAAPKALSSGGSTASTGRTPASIAPNQQAVGNIQPLPEVKTPLSYFRNEVATYSKLVRKIFPSDQDLREKQALFASLEFMKAMGQRLLQPALTTEAVEEQDLAMDFLFEALKSEQELVAEGLLHDVVVDRQVEDASLSGRARENLAGLKGEVLYRWTSLRPAEAERLEKALPGPVSSKVWQNVIDAQSSNVIESNSEIDVHP